MSDTEDTWLYGEGERNTISDQNGTKNAENVQNEFEKIVVDKLSAIETNEISHRGETSEYSLLENEAGEEELPKSEKVREGSEVEEGKTVDEEEDNINVTIGNVQTNNSFENTSPIVSANVTVNIEPQVEASGDKTYSQKPIPISTIINNTTDGRTDEDDKPWRRPGADLSDYFNFGFDEEVWIAYCERQKRIRLNESGAGLPFMMGGSHTSISVGKNKHNIINVVGNNVRRHQEPEINAIQVMTAERREYGKNSQNCSQDMSIPPPMIPPYGIMPPNMMQPMYHNQFPPNAVGYYPPADYYPMYEPNTQWINQEWPVGPSANNMVPGRETINSRSRRYEQMNTSDMIMTGIPGDLQMDEGQPRNWDRGRNEHERGYGYERERERERTRDIGRDHRYRERSHRHRSRSRSYERRSRRRRSRSRSPSHYRTKKSKKSDKSKDSASE